jgi:hypothetical protein
MNSMSVPEVDLSTKPEHARAQQLHTQRIGDAHHANAVWCRSSRFDVKTGACADRLAQSRRAHQRFGHFSTVRLTSCVSSFEVTARDQCATSRTPECWRNP